MTRSKSDDLLPFGGFFEDGDSVGNKTTAVRSEPPLHLGPLDVRLGALLGGRVPMHFCLFAGGLCLRSTGKCWRTESHDKS